MIHKEQSVIKVPEERIGAISGKAGATAKMLEQKLGVSLGLERDGTVTMEGASDKIFFGKDVIKAIGRGFPPETALFIIDKDFMFHLVNLDEFCNTENSVHRVKGRVIGTEGSIKKEIEEMADCYISVYGDTIGIIAPPDSMPMASEAISMLINGAMHSSVLNFLSRKKEELTLSRLRGHREVR
jgi:ribosomal RNA assembly protein